jgi:hypothetical protein
MMGKSWRRQNTWRQKTEEKKGRGVGALALAGESE